MKSLIVLSSIVALLLGGNPAIEDRTDPIEKETSLKVESLHGSFKGYDELVKLEEDANAIIIGTALEQKENYIKRDEDGLIEDFATKRTIKVEQVFKNETGENLSEGDDIVVYEPAVIYENKKGEKVLRTIEGYQLMEDNKKYVLFLRKDKAFPMFVPKSVIFGVYPLQDDTTNSLLEEFEPYKNMHKQVIEKYKK
ncbi:hypothetical protein LOK74_00090 [Brevibacillus humidisoli]|uniref:hypothetical protein n=1 Tax=Brevibacillus humidisoli TaxID=2895522 RepID=UPI001E53FF7B|nr:hypothetical protein [Brevibacillus humidisoli]UFJ41002.1 hypothetical protein LOK74_00090 [Brevibacillus humidisoli]